jgi:hypothetical protein
MLTPSAIAHVLRRGDSVSLAIDIADQLGTCAPLDVPAAQVVRRETVADARKGDSIAQQIYASWLEGARLRIEALSENTRRLRSTMWAQVQLRAAYKTGRTELADRGKLLADWHGQVWGVPEVPEDPVAREQLVNKTIATYADHERKAS